MVLRNPDLTPSRDEMEINLSQTFLQAHKEKFIPVAKRAAFLATKSTSARRVYEGVLVNAAKAAKLSQERFVEINGFSFVQNSQKHLSYERGIKFVQSMPNISQEARILSKVYSMTRSVLPFHETTSKELLQSISAFNESISAKGMLNKMNPLNTLYHNSAYSMLTEYHGGDQHFESLSRSMKTVQQASISGQAFLEILSNSAALTASKRNDVLGVNQN